MKKRFKLAAMLLSAALCCGMTSIPAFAMTNETETTAESTEPASTEEPKTTEEPEELDPLTPDGNLTLVDDISTKSEKQFITVVTKNGNYFYLIIDRDDEGDQTVHFLNQVDEEDLLSLMDEEDADAIRESLGQEEAETEPTITPEPEEKTEPETKVKKPEQKSNGNLFPLIGVLIAAIAGVGIWLYLQTKKKKKKPADAPDPDADYREDDDGYDLPEEEDTEDEQETEDSDEEE
jgi:hypothetical protein